MDTVSDGKDSDTVFEPVSSKPDFPYFEEIIGCRLDFTRR